MIQINEHVCRKCGSNMNLIYETEVPLTSIGSGSDITTSTVDYTSSCASSCRISDASVHGSGESSVDLSGISGSSGYGGKRTKSTYKCEKCGYEKDILIGY